jgi:hypothetical protein
MTGEQVPAHGGSTASKASPPAFDTSVAHQARMYDYVLGVSSAHRRDHLAGPPRRLTSGRLAARTVTRRGELGGQVVQRQPEHVGQGDDREERRGRYSSRLDLAERFNRDACGCRHLAEGG